MVAKPAWALNQGEACPVQIYTKKSAMPKYKVENQGRTTNSRGREQDAHATKVMLVERMMSPIPTRGDTIPPNMNMMAPTSADATPALLCSSFIANATELVTQRPLHASITTNIASYNTKEMPRGVAASISTLERNSPMLATWVHCSGVLNLMEEADVPCIHTVH